MHAFTQNNTSGSLARLALSHPCQSFILWKNELANSAFGTASSKYLSTFNTGWFVRRLLQALFEGLLPSSGFLRNLQFHTVEQVLCLSFRSLCRQPPVLFVDSKMAGSSPLPSISRCLHAKHVLRGSPPLSKRNLRNCQLYESRDRVTVSETLGVRTTEAVSVDVANISNDRHKFRKQHRSRWLN